MSTKKTPTQMSLAEAMAIGLRYQLFRYRPRNAKTWHSCFYSPKKNPDPRAWLEMHDIAIAEIDMHPQSKPHDVSDEAWGHVLRLRAS